MDCYEPLIVAMLFFLAEAEIFLCRPTSSVDLRHLVQYVKLWSRVALLQNMYRTTLQNVLLSITNKYSFRQR